ncbi:MAG: O-methyltransferase [Bacteroidales bacterium]|jgi:predicted O-methyltransferase YrrM|nr:O-methyltransferase [Bacteroidales bacterium]MDD4257328.1 O-methyltransferase [Bacteroidales bacterium]MDD4827635.1 O-methyltransferase [Bacteroidales bacterium]
MDPLQEYISRHSQPQDEVLSWLETQTHYRTIHPRMLSGEPMGGFLTLFVQMISAARILEIGTFTGYSAICMARGLPEGGLLDTIEIFDEQQDLIQEAFKRAGVLERVRLHIGNALTVIPLLAAQGVTYQMVYIDGNKREYSAYYKAVKPLVSPGGYILADNVLWDGKVLDSTATDAQTKGILAFNDLVANDPDVFNVLLPLGDGLMLCKKL